MKPLTSLPRTLALCAVLWPATAAVAQTGAVAEGHLLRIQDQRFYADGTEVLDQSFIFRDGLTVLLRIAGDGSSEVIRAMATAADLEDLKTLLAVEKVATLEGSCDFAADAAPLVVGDGPAQRDLLISWFGRGARRSRHLALGLDAGNGGPFGGACEPSESRLVTGVLDYLERTLTFGRIEEGPASRLLFTVHDRMQEDPSCGVGGFFDDTMIFRDGLFLRQIVDSDGFFTLVRSVPVQDSWQLLNQVLAKRQVGLRGGACRVWFFLPFLVSGSCLDYTWQSAAIWHGRGSRRSVIFGADYLQAECSDAQADIQRNLVSFLRNTLVQPHAAAASSQMPPEFYRPGPVAETSAGFSPSVAPQVAQ